MKWLSAGLTFVNVTTVGGLLGGIAAHGLSKRVALCAAIAGLVAALLAFLGTESARGQAKTEVAPAAAGVPALRKYRSIWFWLMIFMFAIFGFRSFLNVLFIDSNELKIQNPNNLGDLSLHLTYIKCFASGVPLWPDNPIFVFSKLRYPAGIDLFNALLLCMDISVVRGLVWVGILSCAGLCYALYRWGGTFTIAGFLFNGGLVGFLWFKTHEWTNYQDVNYIAWKSLPLTMLVTQRGLLYALPVGLLLLCHWRAKYFPSPQAEMLFQKSLATEQSDTLSHESPSTDQVEQAETFAQESLSTEQVEQAETLSQESLSTEQVEPAEALSQASRPAESAETLAQESLSAEQAETETLAQESLSAEQAETETLAEESLSPEQAETLSETTPVAELSRLETAPPGSRGILPFWVELTLYATMPLFHLHTFMALSFVLAFLFLFLNSWARKQLALLVGVAVLPATSFVWLITDHFHAGSVVKWNPGWVMNNGDFGRPLAAFVKDQASVKMAGSGFGEALSHFFGFWLINFGITLPLIIALLVLLVVRAWKQRNEPAWIKIRLISLLATFAVLMVALVGAIAYLSLGYSLFVVLALIPPVALAVMIPLFASLLQRNWRQSVPLSTPLAFIIPAVLLFLFSCLVKTAPWEWDNIKLIIWSYLIVLPFLWSELVSRWMFPVRAVVCVVLFGSGFFTLFAGMANGRTGYGMADRGEFDAVGQAVAKLPLDARFAAFPTYNHPLLLQGRKCVLGYPGHIWTQGFDLGPDSNKLTTLMNGAPDWKATARSFQVRYLFWGRKEIENYPQSKRPWEQESKVVATGAWGTIYDIESPKDPTAPPPGK